MPKDAVTLPPGFEDLAPYATTWGAADSQESHYLIRQNTPMEELQAFYDAVTPRLKDIFVHLDRFPVDALPPPEALLFRTVCGLAEAAQAVEIFRRPGVPYAPVPHFVRMEWSSRARSND
jgi:hypothetical protein